MGRLAFILFLLYSLPVGLHHLFMDPEHSNGFKFLQMFLTALVSVPTLLTIFTITASMEVAGRMRGGTGTVRLDQARCPWDRPMVLATGLAFVMLFLGGGGGLINMSYGMNAMVHNTSWVTAHFHLIFGGTVVIMYFAIAYAMWPTLTGRALPEPARLLLQLWLWFIGMMVMTLPWHWTGLQGQWRRVAAFDYSDPMIASWGPWVIVSLIGGIILAVSALLFVWNLHRRCTARRRRARGSRRALCRGGPSARRDAGFAQRLRPVEHPRRGPDAARLRLSDRPILHRSAAAGGGAQAELIWPSTRPPDHESPAGAPPSRPPSTAAGGSMASVPVGMASSAALLGFVLIPAASAKMPASRYGAMCRAAGLDAGSPAKPQPVAAAAHCLSAR